jgi:tetratricopeptide (TPR) repeat protein
VGERRALLLILVAVALAYATAFGATFQFDDFHALVDNVQVHGWSAWLASMPGIRPLTKASFTLNWTLSEAPAGFVVVSVLCHAASALAVFLLALRWLQGLAPTSPRTSLTALIAALVFALHPAQTEAVTYIGGRSVVLSGCLYLWALFAFECGRSKAHTRKWILLSVLLFALALGARETAWTLPFALMLLEVARGASLRAAARRTAPHFAVLALAALAIVASPVYRRLLAISLDWRSPAANLFAQVEGIAYLVTHSLLTLRVNFDPDVTVPLAADLTWWITAALIAAVIVGAIVQLQRRPWLAVGILWFFVHLLPTNSVVARYDLINDRQLYLALVGPALIIAVALARLRFAAVRTALAAALAILLGTATLVRNSDYASEIALWQATTRASPSKARPWNNLGVAHELAGDREAARRAYVQALTLDPAYYKARINLDTLGAR